MLTSTVSYRIACSGYRDRPREFPLPDPTGVGQFASDACAVIRAAETVRGFAGLDKGEIVKPAVILCVVTLALVELPAFARERAPELMAQGPVPQAPKPSQPANARGNGAESVPKKPDQPAAVQQPAAEPRASAATGSAIGPRRLSAEERAQLREQIRDMRRRYGTDHPSQSGS